ncbi:hypothetical protein P389DRAFT_57075 [Cystobasidium minutum MCA 4210]|uniref:uncharacterized protein n=1 Tax=Cystobasidium minutum MCA 4210 TaxID=1397322 RepID=UPI0034CE0827|eukprot:jgi/Rhomi1/57075/CE57074_4538
MQASLPPMHQFAKPARNKLHASHKERDKDRNSSNPAPAPQQSKIHHQREASVHNLSLFARLSSFSTYGNHSGGSRRIDASALGGPAGHTRRPSRDGLDWYCRGAKYSPNDDMAESPLEHARTPSLTHSRASSSDSGSGSSVSSSFHFKPLPALPEPKFDSYSPFDAADKLFRPASVAVLEQIDELSVGTFARKNSIETPAHIYLPHLDLASREELSRSPSPSPGWTPRGSAFSMNSENGDDSLSGPFALEASLAKLDVLSEDDEEEHEASRQMLKPLQLEVPPSASQPLQPPSGSFREKPDFSSYTWDAFSNGISSFFGGGQAKLAPTPSPKASPGSPQFVVAENDEASPSPTEAQGRLSVRVPKLSRGGWRGWRSTSQSATPSSRASGDYPTIYVAEHAEDLAQALESSIQQDHQQQDRLEVSTPSGSPKPKLSPKFTFGRGTPSPRLGSREDESPSSSRTASRELLEEHFITPLPKSQAKRGHNTSRATSEDHIAIHDNRQWSWQGSASTKDASQPTLSHRTRLHLRKATTNQGPRNFAQSYDANELQRMRDSAGGRPKYDWI